MAGRRLALLISLLMLALAPAQGRAAASAALDHAQARLAEVQQAARARTLDDATLARLIDALTPLRPQLRQDLEPLKAQLKAADARLAELGSPPRPGAPPEAPAIARARAVQTALRASLDAEIRRGGLLLVETDQLADDLVRRRIDGFSQRLWARSRSLLDPGLWTGVADDLPEAADRWSAVARTQGRTLQAAPRASIALLAAALVLAALLTWPAGRLLIARSEAMATRRTASRPLRRAELAAVAALVGGLLPFAGAALLAWTLGATHLLSAPLRDLAWDAARAVAFAAAAGALGRAILAPRRPEQRPAALGDAMARALAGYPLLVGATAALGALVLRINHVLGYGLSVSLALDGLVAGMEIAVLALALAAVGRSRVAAATARARDEGGAVSNTGGAVTLALIAAWLVLAAAALGLVTGYLAFALFALQELTWVAVVLAAIWLLTRLADEIFTALAADDTAASRFATSTLGLQPRTLDQLAVLASGVSRLLLWLIAWAVILTPFGAGADDLFSRLQVGAASFRLGGVTVSPGAVATAVGVFALGLFATRLFRRWLETRYLPKTRLDSSLAATVTTGVSYAGGLLALGVAINALGIQLTQVTLIASALSVGIGFGLQSVIQNFVAGLILLVGRSIRVGDWITVGGQDGDVQRINVRATQIRMADRSVLIVPNSELVSKTVRNVTWGDPHGLVQIAFTVGYDADPDAVGGILLEVLSHTKGVLKDPAPTVALTEFKDTGMCFAGSAYVSSPRAVYRAKSDALFALARKLREAGVTPGVVVREVAVAAPSAKGGRGRGE
jgi:small-conductance mechanosensitive channel